MSRNCQGSESNEGWFILRVDYSTSKGLERLLLVFEVLHDKRESSVGEQVGVANEEKFDGELHRLPELEFADGSGSNEVAFCANGDGLI